MGAEVGRGEALMAGLEREIKLRYDSAEAARSAIGVLGATLTRSRRLQDDVLLDSETHTLQDRGCALRVRRDGEAAALTWKGPLVASAMKVREEVETPVASADVLLRVFGELGFTPRFRYQKFRTELTLPNLVIAIDETPIGVFVELEGEEAAIAGAASRLGRTGHDYVTSSYRALFLEWQRRGGTVATDMLFDPA